MITFKGVNINIINIIFIQEENKVPICIFKTQNIFNDKKINIFVKNTEYFQGIYVKCEYINNFYEYTFMAYNYLGS